MGRDSEMLLLKNPDWPALGFFIPDLKTCYPLMHMRNVHMHAANSRNNANANRPSEA